MKAIKRHYIITLILVASVFVALGWALARDKSPQATYVTGKVERASISTKVTATGTLQAVRTVQVGSQISGQVQQLFADYNSRVKKGQLLARIDPRTFQTQVTTEQAQVQSAEAGLQAAQADLSTQQAAVAQAEANLEAAKAANENAKVSFDRAQELMDKGLIAKADYDVAKTNLDSAVAKVVQSEAAVQQAKAGVRSKEADLGQNRAGISGAKAGLERAALSLDLTSIYSPVDGVVISRNVDVGQTVAASLSAPTLFVIANDLTEMQVKASVDEADIGKIEQGASVMFTVDAYPKDVFHGTIDEIRIEPQTVQNVVTYNVIVGVANPEMKLKPGMTANITVLAANKENVLTVPNAALRFTPSGAAAAKSAVWTLDQNKKPVAKMVRTGITDGVRTEIVSPDLQEGEPVLIGNSGGVQSTASTSTTTATTPNPFGLGGARTGGRRGGF